MCCMMLHAMDHSNHAEAIPASGLQGQLPLDILRRRFALGEISREELEEMKQVLGLNSEEAESSVGRHAPHPSAGGMP